VLVTLLALVALGVAIGAVALIVVNSGALSSVVRPASRSGEQTVSVAPVAPRPDRMPEIVGKDLETQAKAFSRMGLSVRIVLPSRRTGLISMPESSNEGTELVLPAIDTSFPAARGSSAPAAWSHLVAHQQPAAGTPLAGVTGVVLTAGSHVGQAPESSWYDTHSTYADAKGPSYCLQCHTYDECVECHMRYRTDTPSGALGSEEATAP
jgi:hypothetical protein